MESFYQENEEDYSVLIMRQGIIDSKEGIELNAESSLSNTQFKELYSKYQRYIGAASSEIVKTLDRNAKETTKESIIKMGINQASYNNISFVISRLLPKMSEVIRVAPELKSNQACAQQFVDKFLFSSDVNLNTLLTQASPLMPFIRYSGVSNLDADPKIQSSFVQFTKGYLGELQYQSMYSGQEIYDENSNPVQVGVNGELPLGGGPYYDANTDEMVIDENGQHVLDTGTLKHSDACNDAIPPQKTDVIISPKGEVKK